MNKTEREFTMTLLTDVNNLMIEVVNELKISAGKKAFDIFGGTYKGDRKIEAEGEVRSAHLELARLENLRCRLLKLIRKSVGERHAFKEEDS